jgi:hypothetical protein
MAVDRLPMRRARHESWPGVTLVDKHEMGTRGSETDVIGIRMKPQPQASTQEVLAGLVERVTFHNTENSFCVLRAKARGPPGWTSAQCVLDAGRSSGDTKNH